MIRDRHIQNGLGSCGDRVVKFKEKRMPLQKAVMSTEINLRLHRGLSVWNRPELIYNLEGVKREVSEIVTSWQQRGINRGSKEV